MSIDLSPVEAAIYSWLVPNRIREAMFSHQRVQHTGYPYASVRLVSSSREGGRAEVLDDTDLTRAKSIRVTPTPVSDATYTLTINGTAYAFMAGTNPTAAAITSGLAAALHGSPYTVVDNAGTLDIAHTVVFNVTVSSRLAWANLDAGHEVVQVAIGHHRVLYAITFHVDEAHMAAGGADAYAEAARLSLSFQSVIDAFSPVKIVRDSGIRDITAEVNNRWMSRAQFDLVLRYTTTAYEDTGYIGHAQATGTIDDTEYVFEGPD